MTRTARRTDPLSSHEAAQEMTRSGIRQSQRDQILRLVTHRGGETSAELAQYASLDRYVVARRLPELQAERLVKKGPIRKCRVSGRRAVTWWIRLHADDEETQGLLF